MADTGITTIFSLHDEFESVLTDDARKALATEFKATEITELAQDGSPIVVARAIYLTAKARGDLGVKKAAEALYSQVNVLASRGLVLGHLARLSKLRILAQPVSWGAPFIDPTSVEQDWAVFVFPVVPVTADPEWFGPFWTKEGEMGAVVYE